MYYLPFLGAFASATGTILQKKFLKHKNANPRTYQVIEFSAIILVLLPLLYFFWGIKSQAFSLINIFILISVVGISVVANFFTLYSMKGDKISNLEPAKAMEPLFTVVLAIFFSFLFGATLYERNFKVIIPAIIAGLALVLSHIKRHHLNFNKYFVAAIVGSLFFALELVISKLILSQYTPISFYFVRCVGILILSIIIFRPANVGKIARQNKISFLLLGISWVAYRVILYYGYINLGIISTTLIVMLAPVFIYILAWKFLKEKIEWKSIVAAIVILACVVYAIAF